MRVIFMGTPDFAASALESIIAAGHEVVLVVTKADKPSGRGGRVIPSPVKKIALENGIEVYQPRRIRDEESVERLRAAKADIGVVAAFGQILSAEDLSAPARGCVNIHASLLPLYRGASPIQQAILDGAEKTGITIMQMDEGVDTGDILMQEDCPIAPDETAGSLFDKLARIGASLIVRALTEIEAGEAEPLKQYEARASFTRQIGKEMGKIRWEQPAAAIERQIRAMNPWPSAFTKFVDGRNLKIWEAAAATSGENAPPGCILAVTREDFTVACGEGTCLRVTQLQLEGKKRMSVHDFLLGYSLDTGVLLG